MEANFTDFSLTKIMPINWSISKDGSS